MSFSREWFMLDVRSGDPEALITRLFAAGFDAFFPKAQATALFPGVVFINADPEMERAKLHYCDPDVRFVKNDSNRPMCVPSDVVMALRDGESEAGNTLHNSLIAMAPEYRLDSLNYWFHPTAIRT